MILKEILNTSSQTKWINGKLAQCCNIILSSRIELICYNELDKFDLDEF